MPLLAFEHQFIEVELADRVVNNTIIKQKAQWLSMRASQDVLTGLLTVTLRVLVSLYANDNGAYGELLTGKGLSSYEVTLIADNNSAVNPQTGAVVHIRTAETTDEWQQLLESDPAPLMRQGDWFEMLLTTQSVEISPMLRRFIEQGDQPPFSKFA